VLLWLEGKVTLVCSGEWLEAGPGAFVYGPRELHTASSTVDRDVSPSMNPMPITRTKRHATFIEAHEGGPLIAGFAGSYRRAPRPPFLPAACKFALKACLRVPKAPTARSGLTGKNEAGSRGDGGSVG
jgi:hypothetical protein